MRGGSAYLNPSMEESKERDKYWPGHEGLYLLTARSDQRESVDAWGTSRQAREAPGVPIAKKGAKKKKVE